MTKRQLATLRSIVRSEMENYNRLLKLYEAGVMPKSTKYALYFMDRTITHLIAVGVARKEEMNHEEVR